MVLNEKIKMFFHMLKGAFFRRRSRLLILMVSIVIASSVASGISTLYADIDSKMEKELRTYGANLYLRKQSNGQFSRQELKTAKQIFDKKKLVGFSPYLFDSVDMGDKRFIAAGIDIASFKKVNPFIKLIKNGGAYSVSDKTVLIGKNIGETEALKPGVLVKFKGNYGTLKLRVSGIIESGGVEDDQIFVNTNVLQKLSGQKYFADAVYVSYQGSHESLIKVIKEINTTVPDVEAETINKISKSEGKILKRIIALVLIVSAVIFFSTVLCVAVTLMAMVFERRKEIGLKKALGASNKGIIFEYISESFLLGLGGGILGWIFGNYIAQIISQNIFNSSISLRLVTLPLSIIVSLVITGISSVFPSRLALNIEPARVLKDE